MYLHVSRKSAEDCENEPDEQTAFDVATQLGSFTRLQQVLSLFFPTFMSTSPTALAVLLGSLPSAFQRLTSSYSDEDSHLPVSQAVHYIHVLMGPAKAGSTTDDTPSNGEEVALLERLVLCMCRELLRAEGHHEASVLLHREYSKLLASLDVSAASAETLAALHAIVCTTHKVLRCDKMTSNSLSKFIGACRKSIPASVDHAVTSQKVKELLLPLPDLAALLDVESIEDVLVNDQVAP